MRASSRKAGSEWTPRSIRRPTMGGVSITRSLPRGVRRWRRNLNAIAAWWPWRRAVYHMAANVAVRRCRAWYAALLRLYPRPFQERFGEGMEQTFCDLCRERSDRGRRLFGFAVWIFFETLLGIIRENTTRMVTQMKKVILRAALVALGLLMVPLAASRVVDGWNWPARSFV